MIPGDLKINLTETILHMIFVEIEHNVVRGFSFQNPTKFPQNNQILALTMDIILL